MLDFNKDQLPIKPKVSLEFNSISSGGLIFNTQGNETSI